MREKVTVKNNRNRKYAVKKRSRMRKYQIVLSVLTVIMIWTLLMQIANLFESITVFKDYNDFNISRDLNGGIPLFLQSDERWADKKYGSSDMEISGCGPTCLSMVYCGLTGDTKWDPYAVAKMAEKEGYYVKGVGTSWELMTYGAEEMGLIGEVLTFDEMHIRDALENGKPIICAMGPGDFTTEGHFIVLVGVTEDGRIIVNDPNSTENSERSWELSRLMGQMKNLWGYSVE